MNSPQQQTVISDEYAEEFNKTHKIVGGEVVKKEESDWEGGIIPDCDSCKKTFAEDGSNYNEKDGDLICDDCEEKYECFCQRCGEKIPLGMDETPEEQKEWFNKDDELKFCDDCEDPNCLYCDNCDKHFMRDGEEHDLVHINEDGEIYCQDCLEYCDCEYCNEKKEEEKEKKDERIQRDEEEEVEECDKCGFHDVSYCMSNGCEDVEDEDDNHDLMDFLIEKMVIKPCKEEEE